MNPFKGSTQPQLDPNKMGLDDMLHYRGGEYRHFAFLRQNVRLSRLFLLGTGLGCLGACVLGHWMANLHIFGADGKGGELLSVRTRSNLDDELYNRALQSMMYLAEPTGVAPESLAPQTKGLAEFGLTPGTALPQPVVKRAPHPKYL